MTTVITTGLDRLYEKMTRLNPHDRRLLERAYHRAEAAHEGQIRMSGEPYFQHCLEVGYILADMSMSAEIVAAGLLHDIIEDTDITYKDISREFGTEVADMVDSVTKLTNIRTRHEKVSGTDEIPRDDRIKEYYRKMFTAVAEKDKGYGVIIKLADRLHNMRTLAVKSEQKRYSTAIETMEIYAPLANRLGMWRIKWELEDLSLRYIEPEVYRDIARGLDERREEREIYVQKRAEALRARLEEEGMENFTITSRPKHITSIFRKMQRKNLPLSEIYDVRAIRVIVENRNDCYLVLGLVHDLWDPIDGQFDDYISKPKDNFYRSLHTSVYDQDGKILEVQIRTYQMHDLAENGVAAHWRYKEGGGSKKDQKYDDHLAYMRTLIQQAQSDADDTDTFVDNLKSNVFQDRVYAYTPKADIVDLPQGATVIDFAYHIHTDVGHRCKGAKVNGQLRPLNYVLKTSDQIEIITANRGGPSLDWLNIDLGYVQTSRARNKIR